MSDDGLTDDPCRAADTSSGSRALAFVLLFAVAFASAALVFGSESTVPILLASVVGYTACVMIYGFARNKGGNPPYLFTCPVVVSQYLRLLKRHAVFLAVLIAFVTVVLRFKPHPLEWMTHRNDTFPFYFAVAIPIAILALTEIMTNRGVLERAHNARFGETSAPDALR